MKKVLQRAHLAAVAVFFGTLPFTIEGINHQGIFAGLVCISTLFYYPFSVEGRSSRLKWAGLFSLLFVIGAVGLINTENLKVGVFVLEKKLALLILPFIFAVMPAQSGRLREAGMIAFAFGCICSAVYALSASLARFVVWGDPTFFFYRLFSSQLNMHAIYLSMYYCFAIVVLLHVMRDFGHIRSARTACILGTLLLTVCVVLLAGRTPMLILLLIAIGFSYAQLVQRLGTVRAILISVVIAVILGGIGLIPAKNRIRLREAVNFRSAYSKEGVPSGAAARIYIWNCAYKVFMDNPLIGVGTGDVQDQLNACYKENDFRNLTEVENMQFNAHNQFLEQVVAWGIPGGLVFVAILALSAVKAVRTGNSIYLWFLTIFLISSLTESMLERQSGILFFSGFSGILFLARIPEW